MDKGGRFGTAINCIDGRTQIPVIEWMKTHHSVKYVDMVTEPGVDRVLRQGTSQEVEAIKKKVMVSVYAHQSSLVAVVGHHDCAGNPVSKESHLEDVGGGVEIVSSWGLPIRVVGLWVNEKWAIDVLADTGKECRSRREKFSPSIQKKTRTDEDKGFGPDLSR